MGLVFVLMVDWVAAGIPAIIMSRLFLYLMGKWKNGVAKACFANAASFLILAGLVCFNWEFWWTGVIYGVPQVACLAHDIWQMRATETRLQVA
jgi:hypothetical protein